MKFETVVSALFFGGILFATQPVAGQAIEMNFFLVVQGPTWGPTQPSVRISDSHCHDQAYAEGFGHLTWRVYLTGIQQCLALAGLAVAHFNTVDII